jgi:hypothetical protein
MSENYDGMTCGDCKRGFDEVMDFLVSTAIWNYVMADQAETTYTVRPGLFDERMTPRVEGVPGVVCLACFDKRAREKRVEYYEDLIVFGVGCWMGGHYDRQVPVPVTWRPPND